MCHALVIDDDSRIIEELKDRLKALQHTCDCAQSVSEAYNLLALPTDYSYVLLDLNIPFEYGTLSRIQNGHNVLMKIRQRHSAERLPVIVITNYGLDAPDLAVELMRDGQANDFIGKPFCNSGDTLEKRILNILKKTVKIPATSKKMKGISLPDAARIFFAFVNEGALDPGACELYNAKWKMYIKRGGYMLPAGKGARRANLYDIEQLADFIIAREKIIKPSCRENFIIALSKKSQDVLTKS